MTEPDAEILAIQRREGTYFYRDELKREQVPIISHLTIATLFGDKGSETIWRSHGLLVNMAEGIALYYANNPGMKEAVDGMYTLILTRQGRR